MVHSREDVVGIDASIMMHPEVWRSSGHLANFSDPLVDCKVCGERFRADKAPKKAAGERRDDHLRGQGQGEGRLQELARRRWRAGR
jgi:glycyl-tRNA synthetase